MFGAVTKHVLKCKHMNQWLTPEQAVEIAGLSISPKTLASYPKRSTAENKFLSLGLVFDRKRWRTGAPDYLSLQNAQTNSTFSELAASYTPTESDETDSERNLESDEIDSYDDLESDETDSDEAELVNTDSNETQPNERPTAEPFTYSGCTITITLTLLPDDGDPLGRRVILGVRNSDDTPILAIVRMASLGELPQPLQQLLDQLVADLPNREVRAAIEKAQAEKKKVDSEKRKAHRESKQLSHKSVQLPTPALSTTPESDTSIQLSFF